MGRGVSSGGGQSSLGYLFGSGQPPLPPPAPPQASQEATRYQSVANNISPGTNVDTSSSTLHRNSNNYHRAQGQNSGNFITDRPSTKVQSVPGGGSSLGYLFGSQK